MSRRMHVQWNDLDKDPPLSVKKPSHESDGRSDGTSTKTANTDLYQALSPLYYPLKLCGLLPVRFNRQAQGRCVGRLNTFDIIYSFALWAVIMGGQIYGLWRDLKDGWGNSTRLKSDTSIIVTCSDILGVITLTSVAILGSPFRWKHLQIVMDKIVEVDERLGLLEPKKIRRFSIFLTTFCLVYIVITSVLDMYSWDIETKINKKMPDKGPVNYVPLYFMYTVNIATEIEYAICAYNVGQRFARLNKILENILRTGKIVDHFRKDLGLAGDFKEHGQLSTYIKYDVGPRMFRKYSRNSAETISHMLGIHSSLCDTVQYINNAFGLTILTVTVTCLLHLIITPYFLIMEADGKRAWIFLVVQGIWCIFHTCRLLLIVQPTYAAVTQSRKTAVFVSQLLSASPDTEVRKQLEIFSLQILHRPLEFSACGLFSLDRTLVTSIAGAVTTYLVILIQFQKADDTKGDVDNIIKNATQILKNASTLHNFTSSKLNAQVVVTEAPAR